MARSDFNVESRASWARAINEFVPSGESAVTWTDLSEIMDTLSSFIGADANHALLPQGGGVDLCTLGLSIEPGCVEFGVSERSVFVVKPDRLHLVRIDADPAESFLLLQLAEIEPSGVYDKKTLQRDQEDLAEIPGEGYVSRVGNEHGVYYDADGYERELPDEYIIKTRFFKGQFLIVAKASIWNSLPETYDGRHNRMSIDEVRAAVETLVNSRDEL
jgi:serine/threonine-protein kinase